MAQSKEKRKLIVDVDDDSLSDARQRYQQATSKVRLAEVKRELALHALTDDLGKPDFDRRVEKTIEEYQKELDVTAAEAAKAYMDYQAILGKKINTKPVQRTAEIKRFKEIRVNLLKQLLPECTLVDSTFTDFMGVRKSDLSLFDQIEILPDENTATRVRVKIDGENQSSTLSATWGLEITDDLLTDICKLELGGIAKVEGLVSTSQGGSVRINMETFLTIYQLPNVALEDINPAIHPVDYYYTSSMFGSNEHMDSTVGLHYVGLFEDQLNAQFLSNGLFVTAPEVDYSVVEPGYTLQTGDKIFVGFWFEFEANSSYLAFHLNTVGTTWMRPYIALHKWQ